LTFFIAFATMARSGEDHEETPRDHTAYALSRLCHQSGKWKLILCYDGEIGRYKSSHQYDKGPQLLDLVADPHEKKNLAADQPDVARDLARAIAEWCPLKRAKVLSQ